MAKTLSGDSLSGFDCTCRDLAGHLFEGLYVVDRERRILEWNPAAEEITGYSAAEVTGSFCWNDILRHVDAAGNRLCQKGCPLHLSLQDGRVRNTRVFLHHKLGRRIPVSVRVFPLRDDGGQVRGAVEVFSPHTNRRRLEQRIRELETLSLLDELTGLPNRRFLETRITERLDMLGRYGMVFAVLFIDLDHFKKVNDRYGHAAGDRLLQAVARTLSNSLRRSDLVGRWGGDEFVAILTGGEESRFDEAARKLLLLGPAAGVMLGREEISTTLSIGLTIARSRDTLESLLARADQQLYRCKQEGRNRCCREGDSSVADQAGG